MNIMDKIIIDAPTRELEDAMRDKLLNHFDEQEALKEALERQDEEKFAIQQRDNFVNMMKIKREEDNA